MRIGVIDQTREGWSAGSSYTRTMLESLALAEQGGDTIIFLSHNKQIIAPSRFKTVEIPPRVSVSDWCRLQDKTALDVILPLRGRSFQYKNTRTVGWIPDFQYHHLPELFDARALATNGRLARDLSSSVNLVLLSSESARADYETLFPSLAHKAKVAPFASILWNGPRSEDPLATARKYHLPPRFILVANQFWKHKNHAIIPPALAELRRRGLRVPVVLTGQPSDPRDRENKHLSAFFQECAKCGVYDDVVFLGHLPYFDMIDLMRVATLILQPSLFEGWSTSIEDCKALGRPLICSDIPVHREQAPTSLGYFSPSSPPALADLIAGTYPCLEEPWNPAREAECLEAGRARSREFGLKLLTIAREASLMKASRGWPGLPSAFFRKIRSYFST